MRRARRWLAARITRPFLWMFEAIISRSDKVDGRLAELETKIDALTQLHREMTAEQSRMTEATTTLRGVVANSEDRLSHLEWVSNRSAVLLRGLATDELGARQQLWALRADPDYAMAYDEPEPLVTVSVLVRDRAALLMERSIPSILGQSYENLEVLIVGDDATTEVQAAVQSIQDSRVRFINLTTRVVRESDQLRWLAAGTLPRNEAYRLAAGRWMLDFDDDDALRPTAVADLLALARSERTEVAYGRFDAHLPDGSVVPNGAFPPQLGRFSLASALVHSGLRFFARELQAPDLGVPGDWYRTERMLRVGVTFAFAEKTIFDYYPSRSWAGDDSA